MKRWKVWQSLPRATAPAALGSLVSLAAQGFLALALFRLFSPEEVGVFSATSQLAFFWASLALAQSPLSLLAERDKEPRAAARHAWRQSAWRMLWLAPVASLGAVWSGLGQAAQVWAWAAALGLTQLSWPAHYGVQEAGWLLALLRILSFIPALVHTAWAQVVLSSDTKVRLRPIHVAYGASALVLGVGALVSAAVLWGWLDARWQGLLNFVWPLVAWQMAACFMAAFAHLPFQKGLAAMYSWLCVGINAVFIALCLGGSAVFDFTASAHLGWISAFMVLSLGALVLWIALSPFRHAVAPGSSEAL